MKTLFIALFLQLPIITCFAQDFNDLVVRTIPTEELIDRMNGYTTIDAEDKQQKIFIDEWYRRISFKSDKNENTPYHCIAENGEIEYLQLKPVYYQNYSINQLSKYGQRPPIQEAIEKNKGNALETIKALIQAGANVKARDHDLNTCLHVAAKKNSIELAEFFLNKGVLVNDTNTYGNTALHNAAGNNNLQLVNLLIDHSASLDEKSYFNKTLDDRHNIMHTAAANNWMNILKLGLEMGLSVNTLALKSEYKKNASPIYYAVEYGHLDIVQFLISKGADVNIFEHWYGSTPLSRSIYHKNIEIFDVLMANGASVNIPTRSGFIIYDCFQTEYPDDSYHFAKAIINHPEYIDPLSDEAIKIQTTMGATLGQFMDSPIFLMSPLHWSAVMDWPDLCDKLVQLGTDVNIIDKNGDTSLHKACSYQNIEAAKKLLELGANAKIANNVTETPLDIAKAKKDKELLSVLKGK